MSGNSDERLRRLFAQGGEMAPDEAFVAAVATEVAALRSRRRQRRLGLSALAVMLAVALSVWLAPYAPLSLPDAVAGAAQNRAVRLPGYLYLVIAAGVLPLAGTAWLLRRR